MGDLQERHMSTVGAPKDARDFRMDAPVIGSGACMDNWIRCLNVKALIHSV